MHSLINLGGDFSVNLSQSPSLVSLEKIRHHLPHLVHGMAYPILESVKPEQFGGYRGSVGEEGRLGHKRGESLSYRLHFGD